MSGTITVEILDPVDCKVVSSSGGAMKEVRKHMSYKATYFREGQYSKKRSEYNKQLIDRKTNLFPTGLLPRLKAFCKDRGISLTIKGQLEKLTPDEMEPHVPGKDLFTEQVRIIKKAAQVQRGVVQAPTGIGKTVMIMGLLSMFRKHTGLVLVPNLDLLEQTTNELREHGFNMLGAVAKGDATALENPKLRLVVATKQSFVKFTDTTFCEELDIILVDEVHLFGGFDGQIGKIFKSTVAPMRIGFTATVPEEPEKAFVLEGALGPVLDTITLQEGVDRDRLVKPTVKLVPVRLNKAYTTLNGYKNILQKAIVENRVRNTAIIEQAQELVNSGRSCLIFITQLEHGNRLVDIAELLGLDVEFVQGKTESETREALRKAVHKGEKKCVISSVVWREGVNIPSLGSVILAGGGKTPIGTIQAIGRALRKWEGKDGAIIVDFLDRYRYLAEHTVERITMYVNKGWL